MLPGKKYAPDDYAWMLWRRRWFLAIPALLVASSTLVYSLFLPNKYRASTTILIIPQRVPEEFVKPTVTADLNERLNIMSQTILSRTRLERIVQEFNLYERERSQMIMEDVIERMRRDVTLNVPRARRRGVDSFSVSYQSTNPRTAMRVTERLASLFVQENLEDRELLADQTDQFLKGQLEEARRRLVEQERRLQEFRSRFNGRLPDQVQANLQLLSGAQTRLEGVVETANRDRDRLASVEKSLAELPAVNPSMPVMPAARRGAEAVGAVGYASQQLEVARAELRALELRLKPEHPDIGRAKRAIADLEAKAENEALQQPLSSVAAAPAANPAAERATLQRAEQLRAEQEDLRQRLDSTKRESARLQEMITDLSNRIQSGPGLQSQVTELMRDYSTIQEGYTSLLKKSEESKIAVNLERRQIGEQFRVIDGARLPERPFTPDRTRINGFGVLGGLALGLALIAFLEYRDTSFKSDDDIMVSLSLPVLAVIPVMTNVGERRLARRRKLLLAASASTACMLVAAAVMVLWQYRGTVSAWLQ